MCIKYFVNICIFFRFENLLISVLVKIVGVKRLDGVFISFLVKFCVSDNSNLFC